MAKYKILKEFVMNGVTYKVDDIVNLSKTQESLNSIKANIEKVADNTPLTGAVVSALSGIVPGQLLTPEQKKALAEENIRETEMAHKLAAEARAAQFAATGNEVPLAQAVASSVKDKLEELSSKPEAPKTETV